MVVPTYNEQRSAGRARVERCLNPRARPASRSNSSSSTTTRRTARASSPTSSPDVHRMQVIHRAGKLGLGTAVVAGFGVGDRRDRRRHGRGLQPSAGARAEDATPRSSATNADVLVASRYIPGGSTPDWPFKRRLLSRVACLLARPLSPIRDAASGFFLIRREIAQRVEHQGGRLQDLPRADRPRLADAPGRAAVPVRRSRTRREQDEQARSGRLSGAVEGLAVVAAVRGPGVRAGTTSS